MQIGFAECYEFEDMSSHKIFACKIISKELLQKDNQKDKVLSRSRTTLTSRITLTALLSTVLIFKSSFA